MKLSSSEIIDRMKNVLRSKSDADLSKQLNKGRTTITNWRQRNTVPIDDVYSIAMSHNVTLDWLLTGQGTRHRSGTVVYQDEAEPEEYSPDDVRRHYQVVASGDVDSPDFSRSLNILRHIADSVQAMLPVGGFALIPRLDVEASAGHGAVIGREEVRYTMAFRKDWIRQELRVSPDKLRIISARGDSMDSGQGRDMDIHDGDLLLVNTEVAAIDGDAIYAMQFDGCLVIKRLQRLIDGGVKVISANQAYEAQHISHGDVSGIHISGRVVYVIAGRRV